MALLGLASACNLAFCRRDWATTCLPPSVPAASFFFFFSLFFSGKISSKTQDPFSPPVVGSTALVPASELGAHSSGGRGEGWNIFLDWKDRGELGRKAVPSARLRGSSSV